MCCVLCAGTNSPCLMTAACVVFSVCRWCQFCVFVCVWLCVSIKGVVRGQDTALNSFSMVVTVCHVYVCVNSMCTTTLCVASAWRGAVGCAAHACHWPGTLFIRICWLLAQEHKVLLHVACVCCRSLGTLTVCCVGCQTCQACVLSRALQVTELPKRPTEWLHTVTHCLPTSTPLLSTTLQSADPAPRSVQSAMHPHVCCLT